MDKPVSVEGLLEEAERAFLLLTHISSVEVPDDALDYIEREFHIRPFFEGSAYLPPLDPDHVKEWGRRVVSVTDAARVLEELETAIVKRYALNPQEVAMRSIKRVLFTWEFVISHVGAWVMLMVTIGQQTMGLLGKTGNAIGKLVYLWWIGETELLTPVDEWSDGPAKDAFDEISSEWVEATVSAWDYVEIMVVATLFPIVQMFATGEAVSALCRPCVEEGFKGREAAVSAALPQRRRKSYRRRRRARR